MATLALTAVQGTATTFEGEVLGTTKDLLVKTDKPFLSNKELKGEVTSDYVTLFLQREGESKPLMLACSKPVSKEVRKQIKAGKPEKNIIAALLGLPVLKIGAGNFISFAGKMRTLETIDSLLSLGITMEDLKATV